MALLFLLASKGEAAQQSIINPDEEVTLDEQNRMIAGGVLGLSRFSVEGFLASAAISRSSCSIYGFKEDEAHALIS